MNPFQRFTNAFIQFPTWIKIFFAIASATFIPLFVLLIILGRGIEQTNTTNLAAYLEDVANEHREELNRAIDRASDALISVSENVLFRNQILTMLNTPDNSLLRRTVVNLLTNRLIESELFEDVRILNGRGRVIVDSNDTPLDTDVSQTDAGYRAGLNAQLIGNRIDRVVYQESEDEPNIDIVVLLYNNEDLLVGYLIGTINEEELLYHSLEGHDTFIAVHSYMVSRNGTIFADDENIERARISAAVSPVERALFGQSGLDTYTVSGEEVTGYYTPISNNEFALIIETVGQVVLVPPIGQVISNNIAVLILLAGLVGGLTIVLLYMLNIPIRTLRNSMNAMILGDFEAPILTTNRTDELGGLSRDLVDLREQVRLMLEDQERRLALRTRNIRATQEISRYAATQRNTQILMDEVVNLIINLFSNIYHAQIFLMDDDNRYAVLRASTGKPGRQLLARGHRLARGSTSVIGQVTAQGRTIIATDTASNEFHRKNEFLPDTLSELAIPLRVGDRLIGALDVQSRESNTFASDQITILETMADQIAISLDSARLYQESIQRLQEIERSRSGSLVHEWQDFLYDHRTQSLTVQAGYETETDDGLRDLAIQTGQTQIGAQTERRTVPFAVPIRLRGTVLGAAQWELPIAEFSQGKVQLAEELVNRLALTLENARLFEQSQRTAERERVVNEIAGKLTGKTDIDEILQTAVREVGQALRAPEVNIRLNLSKQSMTTNEPSGATSNGTTNSGTASNGHKE